MLNYLGQLRVYSLVDLVVLLIACGASSNEFLGAILLHIGFLAYLESRHQHSYRKNVPKYTWLVLILSGLLLYAHIEGFYFVIFSYLYTLKNKKYFALFSPLMRGFQNFFIVAGIIGYNNNLIWLVLILLTLRNLGGDFRDTVKDTGENMKTLPVVMGLKTDMKKVHLLLTILTTLVWFSYTYLSLWLLVPIILIQIFSYNLTPR